MDIDGYCQWTRWWTWSNTLSENCDTCEKENMRCGDEFFDDAVGHDEALQLFKASAGVMWSGLNYCMKQRVRRWQMQIVPMIMFWSLTRKL